MRSVILFPVFLLAAQLQGQDKCSTVNFEPGGMDETALRDEFKPSVLRIQVQGQDDSGTGYLIDNVHGYVITAFHVVKSWQPGMLIDVSSPAQELAATKITAKPVKSLGSLLPDGSVQGVDLAILQLDVPSQAKSLRPVDISLRYPSPTQLMYAMGYPQPNSNEPNTTFYEHLARWDADPPDGSIQVAQETFSGNSGGPLMNSTGSAIGTCRETFGTGHILGRYTPMSDGKDLLDLIPITDRMASIDERIRNSSIKQAEFRDLLVKNSRNPTNLELYAWGRFVLAHPDQYPKSSTRILLSCALRAFMQRGLEDLVIDMSNFANGGIRGDAKLALAQREFERHHLDSARIYLGAAENEYGAANSVSGSARASMLAAQMQLERGSFAEAQESCKRVLAHFDLLSDPEKAKARKISAEIKEAARDPGNSQTAANDAIHRADSLDAVVKGLDNYKSMASVTVNFGFDKATLTKEDKEKLDTFAQQLENAKGYILEVTGETASTGSSEYNYEISNRRADAVVQFLASQYGIAAHRFYLIGIGKDKEVAPNTSAEGRKQNRVVQIQLLVENEQVAHPPPI